MQSPFIQKNAKASFCTPKSTFLTPLKPAATAVLFLAFQVKFQEASITIGGAL
jgi:hypothetical protein